MLFRINVFEEFCIIYEKIQTPSQSVGRSDANESLTSSMIFLKVIYLIVDALVEIQRGSVEIFNK